MFSSETLDLKKIVDSYFQSDHQENREVLMAPYKFITHFPYINIYPKLIDSLNVWTDLPEDKVKLVKDVIELWHTSLVLSDDIIDGSDFRRGFPTAYRIYGPDRTWLTAISLVVIAFEKIASTNKPKAYEAFQKNVLHLYGAVAKQFDVRNSVCLNKTEYIYSAIGRTGSFYMLIVELMQSFSDCKKDFSTLIGLFGLYIQVQNDYMNVSKDKFMNDKDFAEDISSGTSTLPIVLASESKTLTSDIIINILKQKTHDSDLKNYCADLLEHLGTIKDSRKLETKLYEMLMEEIEILGGNSELIATINQVHSWKNDELFPNHPEHKSELYN